MNDEQELLSGYKAGKLYELGKAEYRKRLPNSLNIYEQEMTGLVRVLEAQIAKLKAMGYEQVWTKCPDCMNGQIMTGHRVWHPCPTCKGTGRKRKLVKWDREKVAEAINPLATSYVLSYITNLKQFDQQLEIQINKVVDQLKEILIFPYSFTPPLTEEELRIGNKLTANLTDKCRELEQKIEEAKKQRDIQWVKFLMHEKHYMSDIPPTDYGQALKGD